VRARSKGACSSAAKEAAEAAIMVAIFEKV